MILFARGQGLVVVVVVGMFAACGDDGPAGGGGSSGAGLAGKGGASSAGAGGSRAESGQGGEAASAAGDGAGGSSGSSVSGRGGSGAADAGEGGSGDVPARFRVTVEPAELSAPRGATAVLRVTVTRDAGFTDPVSITTRATQGIDADVLVLPGAVGVGELPIMLDGALAAGTDLALGLTATGGGATALASLDVSVVNTEPTSQALIRDAEQAGTIDYETSLLYREYALFGDDRLPSELRGWGSEEEDSLLSQEIESERSNLSPGALAALERYRVRPPDDSSAWNEVTLPDVLGPDAPQRAVLAAVLPAPEACPPESGSWVSKRSGTRPVRAWAQCTGDVAHDAESVRLLDLTLGILDKVFGPETALMGPPLLDLGGGDDAIDFYIVDPGSRVHRSGVGYAPDARGNTENDLPYVGHAASAFVMLPRPQLYLSRFHFTVSHELFHVLQLAHGVWWAGKRSQGNASMAAKQWFVEASATWAGAYFDRTLAPWPDGRASYVSAHLRFLQRILPSHAALNVAFADPHDYAAYIWPYFVEQETGGADFMASIWNGLGGLADNATLEQADDIIDAAFPFDEHFRRFALRNLNDELVPGDPLPETERYVHLDPAQFPDKHGPPKESGTLNADQDFDLSLDFENLTARYVELDVADTRTHQVELDFSELSPTDRLDVLALVRTTDDWVAQPYDFSDENQVTFCFDDGPATVTRRGSFDRILLVLANHALRAGERVSGPLHVHPKSEPCALVWTGTVTSDQDSPFAGLGTLTTSTTAQVTFEFDPLAPPEQGSVPFRVKSGSGSYTFDALYDFPSRVPACRTLQSASGAMLDGQYDPLAYGTTSANLNVITDVDPQEYVASGITAAEMTEVSNCNDLSVDETLYSPTTINWWRMAEPLAVSDDGQSIEGSYDLPDGLGGTIHYQWHLDRVGSP